LHDPVAMGAVEHDAAVAVLQEQPDLALHVHRLLHGLSPRNGHWNPKLPSKTEMLNTPPTAKCSATSCVSAALSKAPTASLSAACWVSAWWSWMMPDSASVTAWSSQGVCSADSPGSASEYCTMPRTPAARLLSTTF